MDDASPLGFLGSYTLLSLSLLVGMVTTLVAGGIASFLLADRFARPQNRPMLPAFVLQSAQVTWFAVLFVGAGWYADVLLMVGWLAMLVIGLAWLLLRPGWLIVVLLTAYQVVLLVGSLQPSCIVRGPVDRVADLLGEALRVLAVWLMVRGLLAIRRAAAVGESALTPGGGTDIVQSSEDATVGGTPASTAELSGQRRTWGLPLVSCLCSFAAWTCDSLYGRWQYHVNRLRYVGGEPPAWMSWTLIDAMHLLAVLLAVCAFATAIVAIRRGALAGGLLALAISLPVGFFAVLVT